MIPQDGAQWLISEVLKASQDGMVNSAAEARDPFVAHPQSDKGGLIEVEGKAGFRSRAIFVDQATVDAYDFQGALFEVMCFLCVQSQDLPCHFAVSYNE